MSTEQSRVPVKVNTRRVAWEIRPVSRMRIINDKQDHPQCAEHVQ